MRLFVVLVTPYALATQACSLLTVRGPPDNYHAMSDDELMAVDCTRSPGKAIVDTALAAGALAGALTAPLLVADDPDADQTTWQVGLGMAGAAVVFAAWEVVNLVVGFRRSAACRQAKRLPFQRSYGKRARRETERRAQPPYTGADAALGCLNDMQCKGERICVDGRCAPPSTGRTPSSGSEGYDTVPEPD